MKPGEVARNVSRGAFFLALEKGLASVSTILYSAIVARWLGPPMYGVFTLGFSMMTLAGAFTGNFELYLERHASEYELRGRLGTLARAFRLALLTRLGLGLLAAVVMLVLTPRLAAIYRLDDLAWLLPFITVFMVSDGVTTVARSLLFGLQRYGWVSGSSLILNFGRLVLAVSLWGSHHGMKALAIGLSGLSLLQALVVWGAAEWLLRQRARSAPATREAPVEGGLLRHMVAYCAPLYGANLSFLSGQHLSKLVLGLVLTPAQLGLFSFAFTTVERLVEIVYTLPRALLPSLTLMVTNDDREKLHNVFTQAFRLVQLVACALAFVLFVYARELILLVGGPMYQKAMPMLRVLALVPIVRTAQQPLTMLFQAARRPGYVLSLALVKLGFEVTGWLVLVLALHWGAVGACWSNVAGAVAAFVGAMALSGTLLPEGARERVRTVLASLALMLPLLFATLVADRWLGVDPSLGLRLALVPVALLALPVLGLLVGYDLEKLASLPMPSAWMAGARDRVVTVSGRVVRVLQPGAPR